MSQVFLRHSLTNWSAKRSGASITVTGIDVETGRIERATLVSEIRVMELNGERGIFAEAGNGVYYRLLPN